VASELCKESSEVMSKAVVRWSHDALNIEVDVEASHGPEEFCPPD
jgi:hypothetical protein